MGNLAVMPPLSKEDISQLLKEVKFTTSRSQGPGGQNVNKVNTKVILKFNISDSKKLSASQKNLVSRKLSNQISNKGELILSSQEERSQTQNKEVVSKRFIILIKKALKKPKPRIASKPSKASVEKRLREKKEISEKKKRRRGFE